MLPESRWRGPDIPWSAALLLLPVAPACAVALDADARMSAEWQRVLGWWGLERGPVGASGGLVLSTSAEAAVATGAESILLAGPDPVDTLVEAGYLTRTWTARVTAAGAVALTTTDGLRPTWVRASTPRAAVRAAAVAAVRRFSPASQVTVGSRVAGPPALVDRTGAERTYLVAGGGGPRRRPVLVTAGSAEARPTSVVKVSAGRDAERGRHEQQVLGRLHAAGLGAHLPRPLGDGRLGPFAWSAESAAVGRPLADLLGERPQVGGVRHLLGEVASWLGALGATTRAPRSALSTLPLAGVHSDLACHLEDEDLPGVLLHGDLAAGFNLLVDEPSWVVIDWETARAAGPPLVDLLPLLTGSLAALRAPDGAAGQSTYVLRLCAGLESDSQWLFDTVVEYLRTVGVRRELAGTLAGVAFGYQASMRLVHEQLVRAAGAEPTPWRSLWDDVAQQWLWWPGLGPGWPALQATLRR